VIHKLFALSSLMERTPLYRSPSFSANFLNVLVLRLNRDNPLACVPAQIFPLLSSKIFVIVKPGD